MDNVRILDCTLRDGGRIIDCNFKDNVIVGMSGNLAEAGIEIIEVGFLRDEQSAKYNGNSTFFTGVNQINALIKNDSSHIYTAFIDYEMFDFNRLEEYNGEGIGGIRVGFTKKQYTKQRDEIAGALKQVKDKGYKLFVQAVNTPGYSDKEMLELVEMINEIHPYSFGIVDTYGSLYLEDLSHIFDLVERNLAKGICIDIHSHNNLQSSFAFAQEIIRIAPSDRQVILDATLNGMGKCAGNLNTELIVDYLNRKKSTNYDLDLLLDTIDLYLAPLKEKYTWGYSIPAFMAGIYKSHPNNVIYLTEKYRLKNKDIKYILSGIDEAKRQLYDYDNIARIYEEYFSDYYNDKENIEGLRREISGRNVVILAPGKSINKYSEEIKRKTNDANAIVISVNFEPKNIDTDYVFYANAIHFSKRNLTDRSSNCIVTSNIHEEIGQARKINYTSLIEEGSSLCDNSTIMLLNLLSKLEVKQVMIAGFDGITANEENYASSDFVNSGHGMKIDDTNREIARLYSRVRNRYKTMMWIELITPSIYENML